MRKTNKSNFCYLLGVRSGFAIINLEYTLLALRHALLFAFSLPLHKRSLLCFMVLTKSYSFYVKYSAIKARQAFFINKWINGFFSNFRFFKKTLKHYYNFTNLKRLPFLVVCFNLDQKSFVVEEFKKARVASIGFMDTNMTSNALLYKIPSNDDSLNSLAFYCDLFVKLSLRAKTREVLRLKRSCKKLKSFFVRYFFKRFVLFCIFFEKFFNKISLFLKEYKYLQSMFLLSKFSNLFHLLFSLVRKWQVFNYFFFKYFKEINPFQVFYTRYAFCIIKSRLLVSRTFLYKRFRGFKLRRVITRRAVRRFMKTMWYFQTKKYKAARRRDFALFFRLTRRFKKRRMIRRFKIRFLQLVRFVFKEPLWILKTNRFFYSNFDYFPYKYFYKVSKKHDTYIMRASRWNNFYLLRDKRFGRKSRYYLMHTNNILKRGRNWYNSFLKYRRQKPLWPSNLKPFILRYAFVFFLWHFFLRYSFVKKRKKLRKIFKSKFKHRSVVKYRYSRYKPLLLNSNKFNKSFIRLNDFKRRLKSRFFFKSLLTHLNYIF